MLEIETVSETSDLYSISIRLVSVRDSSTVSLFLVRRIGLDSICMINQAPLQFSDDGDRDILRNFGINSVWIQLFTLEDFTDDMASGS